MGTISVDLNLTLRLQSWQPGESGLPGDLFRPHCLIKVVQGSTITENYLSWPYGGQPGGDCTLGPWLHALPPDGHLQLVIPGKPPQSVGVKASSRPESVVVSLTNLSTGKSGEFTAQAQKT